MKTPICTFDAKAAILCTKCETKLRLGHLTHADVDGAIKISRLAERNHDVNKFTMVRASKVDDDFIPSLRGSDISFLRTNPSLINKSLRMNFRGRFGLSRQKKQQPEGH